MRFMRPHLAPLCLGFNPAGFQKMSVSQSGFLAVVVAESFLRKILAAKG